MASPGALNLSIVSLGSKDPFIHKAGFPELMIHIGGQDKMRFFLHQFKNLLIKRKRLWLNSVQICMFGPVSPLFLLCRKGIKTRTIHICHIRSAIFFDEFTEIFLKPLPAIA